ncbi:MAG: cellulase family glycosylhydrolase [Phycisphaeraceae bacterium]|nr:cellulase family glycosylhydrolase [Phycisphaeraceae bacterium]
MRWITLACVAGMVVGCNAQKDQTPAAQWTVEEAQVWAQDHGWLVGCNFSPSTAINQLEMWQAESFDPNTIDRELGWAHDLGFNTIRVYLHDLLWQQDSEEFLARMDTFLDAANKHGIGVMFVLLDACWDPSPVLGTQREPKPHLHNSGWVQSPGKTILSDPTRHDELKAYVQGVITHFQGDQRIYAWDMFNEPDNRNIPAYVEHEPDNKEAMAFTLLKKAFAWAREAHPTQPLTAGVWKGDWSSNDTLSELDQYMLEHSDVITFHSYANLEETRKRVEQLKRYNRPMLCTEYMARPTGSTFESILPYFKEQNIGAYNWGFVAGKTQTIYPWDSWTQTYTDEPPLWFHDIFRVDGTAYLTEEVALIRSLTGSSHE